MSKWHIYRRRLIRRVLKGPALLFVLDPDEVRTGVNGDWL
jgi:hypothetical protein